MTSAGIFCGNSADNDTWQQDIEGSGCYSRMMLVLTSHTPLVFVGASYLGLLQSGKPASINLNKSELILIRLIITILSAALLIWGIVSEHSSQSIAGVTSEEFLIDVLASLVWVTLVISLWKMSTQRVASAWTHLPVIGAWVLASLILCFRLTLVVQRLKDRDESFWPGDEEGVVFTWSVLQILFLVSLLPAAGQSAVSEEHVKSYIVPDESKEDVSASSSESTEKMIEVGVAEDTSSLLSKLTFGWAEQLIRKGALGQIKKPEDVFLLPKELSSQHAEAHFSAIYPQGSAAFAEDAFASDESDQTTQTKPDNGGLADKTKAKGKLTLLRALIRAFGRHFLLCGLLRFANHICEFSGPLLIYGLISFIEDQTEPARYGFYYASGLVLTTALSALVGLHFHCQITKVSIKIRAALMSTVYRKSLAVSATALSGFTTGEITSIMSTDTDRITCFGHTFHALWSIPLEIIIAMVLLYQQVGRSALAALCLAVLLTPITKYVMTKLTKMRKAKVKQTDERVKFMNEILNGIRVIKFYAWERVFGKQVDDLRMKELRSLRSIRYVDCINGFVWAVMPVLLSLVTFTTYTLLGNKLSAAQVFTCLALLGKLMGPMNGFPWVVNGVVEAWVSLKKLQEFMDLEESDLKAYYTPDGLAEDECLKIQKGNFQWKHPKKKEEESEGDEDEKKDDEKKYDNAKLEDSENNNKTGPNNQPLSLMLQDIDLSVLKGQLIGVSGKVGSGKSSLFSAIIADMAKDGDHGSISVSGLDRGFGLATQVPWLQHATVKDNILFGSEYKAEWYNQVVDACALSEDLKILPAGDETQVGEKGITLSGGQKARVALARAVYQDKDIYLLDDPMAAVDPHVGQHIFSRCVMGLLKDKTRVLCTHHVKYLMEADIALIMDDFKIVDIGAPKTVLTHSQNVTNMKFDDPKTECTEVTEKTESEVKGHRSRDGSKLIAEDEEKEEGGVSLAVYRSYWNAIGTVLAPCVVISIFIMQAAVNIGDWWLSHWIQKTKNNLTMTDPNSGNDNSPASEANQSNNGSYDATFYLGVYGALIGVNACFRLLQSYMFANGRINASITIHQNLLDSIFRAPLSFFEKTPMGRILSRFSKDVDRVDHSIPVCMEWIISMAFQFMGAILVVCYGLPLFVVFLIPTGYVYYRYQEYYRKTSRELRRIWSCSGSAIHSHFSESLDGAAIIKAMRNTKRFRLENHAKIELNHRNWFSDHVVSYWLYIRLQMMGVTMLAVVAFLALLQHHYQVVEAGLVGLSITYALQIMDVLFHGISSVTEMEKVMISAERVQQYTDGIPSEPQDGIKAPPQWPKKGVIRFNNVRFSYKNNEVKALDGVSFETLPGEKIGIVGRTGSGKSTLFLTLFRMVGIQGGEITIDGVNLADLSLEEIRSKLAIIPQDPFLFSATVKENLDPVGQFSDPELWGVLEKCHLKDVVTRMGGLQAMAGEGGKAFSTGQKQLVCLARAMLTKAKVLCIDEATASVDMVTDSLLQKAIQEEFRDNTVLTIAHRINTLTNSDRILVMNAGRVEQFGKASVTTEML